MNDNDVFFPGKNTQTHVFNVYLALEVGLEQAIILHHFIEATLWAQTAANTDSDFNYPAKLVNGNKQYFIWGDQKIWATKFPYFAKTTFYRHLNSLVELKLLDKSTSLLKNAGIRQTVYSANLNKINDLLFEKIYKQMEQGEIEPERKRNVKHWEFNLKVFKQNYDKTIYYRIHYFKVAMAQKLGVPAALIFQHILYYLDHNLEAEKFIFVVDGIERPYVLATRVSLKQYFPYLSDNVIRGSLSKLRDKNLIILTPAPNKQKKNKDNWATLPEKLWRQNEQL